MIVGSLYEKREFSKEIQRVPKRKWSKLCLKYGEHSRYNARSSKFFQNIQLNVNK